MLTSQWAQSARKATFSAGQRPALNFTDTESKTKGSRRGCNGDGGAAVLSRQRGNLITIVKTH